MNTASPILKAVETEDGITLYSPDKDPADAGVARVMARLYPQGHPEYAWARSYLDQAAPPPGEEPR
jgi:hypothetical protein